MRVYLTSLPVQVLAVGLGRVKLLQVTEDGGQEILALCYFRDSLGTSKVLVREQLIVHAP
jgi:hypothetical protein